MGAKSLSRDFVAVTDEDVVAIVHGEGSNAVVPWPAHTCEKPLASPLSRDPLSWVCRARGRADNAGDTQGGSQCRGRCKAVWNSSHRKLEIVHTIRGRGNSRGPLVGAALVG